MSWTYSVSFRAEVICNRYTPFRFRVCAGFSSAIEPLMFLTYSCFCVSCSPET